MKRLLQILCFLAGVLIIFACAAAPPMCPSCPPGDAAIVTNSGCWIFLEKGHFDDRNNWYTRPEFNELVEQYKRDGGL